MTFNKNLINGSNISIEPKNISPKTFISDVVNYNNLTPSI